jgi:hypothetical protein
MSTEVILLKLFVSVSINDVANSKDYITVVWMNKCTEHRGNDTERGN